MKKKHLNTIKIASLTLMLGCFALGGVYNHYEKQQDNIVKVERKVQPKYASYDDDDENITLTAEELNTYTFRNFGQGINFNYEWSTTISLNYNENNFVYRSMTDDQFGWEYGDYCIYFINDQTYLDELKEFVDYDYQLYHFYILDIDQENVITFEYPLIILVNEDYNTIKSYIEADIQANQPVSMGDSIVGAITSGLGLIPDLANEFLTGFSTLFWNSTNDTLTTFGLFALVFLGIAITMAVIKLVLAIIRGNTGA